MFKVSTHQRKILVWLRGQWQNRPSVLDEYKPYLDDRCTNAWKLWEEIVPLGYQGSYQRLGAYLRRKRTSPRLVTAQPPSPRTVAGWILRRPTALSEAEQLQLKTVLAHCLELDALTRHVRSFAVILTERQGERLPDWLDAVRQDGLPSLRTLAAGIDRGREAVIAGTGSSDRGCSLRTAPADPWRGWPVRS